MLVGYGPAQHRGPPPSAAQRRDRRRARRPRRRSSCPRPTTARAPTARRCSPPRPTRRPSRCATAAWRSAGRPRRTRWRGDAAPAHGVAHGHRRPRPLAKPPVRKYAKDLGVDLDHGHRHRQRRRHHPRRRRRRAPPAPDLPRRQHRGQDFRRRSPAGGEQRIPIKGVRKHTAAAMVASAFTAPHVTEFLTVDVTRMMKLRQRLAAAARAGRRQGQPAAVRGPGAAARRPPAPDGQQLAGTRRPRRSWSRTT